MVTKLNAKKQKLTIYAVMLLLSSFGLNAQTGPGGVGNPDGSNGQPRVVLWLDASTLGLADGADVSSWNDLSGNNNHATQATTNNMPVFQTNIIGTMPTVRFRPTTPNRTQTWLEYDGSYLVGSPYSIFAVTARRSLGFKMILGGSVTTGNQNLHWGWRDNTQFTLAQYGNDINRTLDNSTASNFSIISSIRNNTATPWGRAIFQNSTLQGATDNNITLLSDYPGAAIGRYNSQYYDVDVSEIIQFSSALTESQRIIVENYLSIKYGLGLTSNSYYSNATYSLDLVGIGTTDGSEKHGETTSIGSGINLKESNSSLDETNEFVFAGHSGTPHGIDNSDLPDITPVTLSDRWQRIYFVQRIQDGSVDAGSTDISIGFDFTGTGIGQDLSKVYYLLYRAGTSGTFSVVPGGTSTISNNQIWFNVSSANFSTGYYTIAKSSEEVRTWYSFNDGNWNDFNTWSLNPDIPNNPGEETPGAMDRVIIQAGKTVLVTDDGTTAGLLEVNNGILDFGSTISNSFSAITGLTNGRIRLSSQNFPSGDASGFAEGTTGGTVEYYGTGYSLTATRTFNNMIVNLNDPGNTLTLMANFTLNGNLTVSSGIFRINDNSSTSILTIDIAKDLIVEANGQVTVGQGNTIGSYSIPGTMPALGQYHSIYHQVRIGGGLTNNGTIEFTNQTAPVYNQFTTTGAATVTFYGSANQRAELYGTTNFYNLIIDKGIDRTFELEVYTENVAHFKLFGPNSVGRQTGGIYTAANPEVRKALWIKTGTLRLTGSVVIPSLSEGNQVSGNGDYPIPGNGKLWIDGADVEVYSTARTASAELDPGAGGVNDGSSNQALSVYGEFHISDGYFNTRNSAGFIFWADASAVIRIEGGLSDVAQFRSANAVAGGKTSFLMTGGELMVRGNRQFTYNLDFGTGFQVNPDGGGEITGAYPAFGIVDSDGVFQMSGGKIYIADQSGNNTYNSNGVCIQADLSNHQATGGTFYILMNNGDNYDIISDGPLWSLEIDKLSGTNEAWLHMGSDLTLMGNLTIRNYTTLISRREHSNYRDPVNDLTVARSFLTETNSNYLPYSNTTTLYSTFTANANFSHANQQFFNLVVMNNPATSNTRRVLGGNANALTVHNNLTIETAAVFRHANKDILVKGNVYNSGTIELTDPATNTGNVILTDRGIVTSITLTNAGSHTAIPTITITGGGGSGATAIPVFNGIPAAGNALPLISIEVTNSGTGYTSVPTVTIGSGGATATAVISTTHELGGDGNGVFGNLEIDEVHPSEAAGKVEVTFLTANQTVSNTLNLANGIVDLDSYNLHIQGSLSSETIADYSETKLIRLKGDHGDGGVSRTISADGTYLYPIGTYNSTVNSNRYGWANPTFSNVTDDGIVQINSVPRKLATLSDDGSASSQRYLLYYWRVRHTGFSSIPNVQNQFIGYVADFTWNGDHTNHMIGKVVGNVRYNDDDDDLGPLELSVDSKRILNYSTIKILETGEFTAGFKPVFNGIIQVFYSRLSTSDWYATTSNWNNNNNWSFEPHNGSVPDNRAAAGDYPKAGDIAVIGYGGHNSNGGYHSMNILATEIVNCADIQFVPNPTPGAYQSRLVLRVTAPASAAGLTAGIIQGPGTFMMRVQPALFPTVSADFSEFVNEELATINYYLEANGDYSIPNGITTTYPNLRIEGGGGTLGNRRATIQEDFLVKRNFTIDQGGEFILHTGAEGDFIVYNYLYLGGGTTAGRLSFGTTGTARVVEVQNIALRDNANNAIRAINTTPSSLEHRLILNESVSQTNGGLNLYNAGATSNNIILEVAGETDATITITGGTDPSLYILIVDKGSTQTPTFTFNNNFTLNGPTNGTSAEKALQLQNGTLILNHPDIDITLSSDGEDFIIGPTTGLTINQGTARVTNPVSGGIFLDGYLTVSGEGAERGELILDGGVGSDNYILYSSSGNARLDVLGGYLEVGSQVRSTTANNLGVLRYRQLAKAGAPSSTVIVGKRSAPVNSRGVFEIMNTGSQFQHFNGTLTIVRGHDTPASATRAAFYLNTTSTGTNEWPTIQFGSPVDNPGGSIITVNSSMDLPRTDIDGNATARLMVNSLGVIGDMEVTAGSAFDGNGLNLTLYKNLVNSGTADINTDSLYFSGTTQTLTGDVIANDVIVEPETSLTLQAATGLTVEGNLTISQGQLIDGSNTITLLGDVTNNSSHVSTDPNAGGLLFNGVAIQRIYGSGQFGRLEVDNPVRVQLEGSMTLNNHLTLTNGILHLQHHGLTLGQNADVLGAGFNADKMIAVYGGGFTPQGLRKNLPILAGANPTDPYDAADPAYTWSFTFPVGSDDGTTRRYMPMDLYVANNSGGGYMNVVPVNDLHITFSDPDQNLHVLNQYWEVTSSGVAQFSALQRNHYTQDAVFGLESDYIGASLYQAQWSKFLESAVPPVIVVVDEANNWINYVHTNVNLTSGDYTAGETDWIPDQVPTFYSKQDGDWTDPDTWERNDGGIVPANGPVGQIVHVRTAHTVTVSSNFRRAYQTTVNGRLQLGTTLNHILGYVGGTGTLAIESNSVPTGDYTDFFGCGGGTMEYGGAGPYTLSDRYTHYHNLTITGSGTKTLPSLDMTICGDLRIEGSATFKQPAGPSSAVRYNTNIIGSVHLLNTGRWDLAANTNIYLGGNFTKSTTSTFTAGYTRQLFDLNGNTQQIFSGSFTNPQWFNNFRINSTATIQLLDPIDIKTYIYLVNGRVQNNSSSLLTVTLSDGSGLISVGNGFVEGPIRVNLRSTSPVKYLPVGKNNVRKFIYPLDLPATVGYWTGEYFAGSPTLHAPPMDHGSMVLPLETISQSEYWRITGPSGEASRIRLTLDGTSDVAAGVSSLSNLRIVYWNGTDWQIAGTGATTSGTASSGTISTTGTFTFSGAEQYFTIGAVEEVIIPTAQITSADAELCEGGTYQLRIALTGNGPWQIDYNDGTTSYTNVAVPSSPHTIDITGMAQGSYTYTLDAVRDNVSTPGFIYGPTPSVTVYANPAPFNVTSGGDICGGTTTTIHLDGSEVGFTYQLYRNGAYFGAELAGTGGALTFTGVDQQGDYTVRAFNTLYTGCTAWMAGTATVNLGSSSTAEITQLLSASPICDGEVVELRIAFTGTPPFTFTLTDGQGTTWADLVALEADLSGTGPYTFDLTVPTNPVWIGPGVPTVYTYTLTTMSDSGGCGSGTVVGAGVSVDVYKVPETGPQFHIPNTW